MAKLSTAELRAILDAARSSALGADTASTLSAERTAAQNYYNGDMTADMPAADGRSSAVSNDVSDTVEGLLPPLMEIFAGGEEVVRFEPVGPEDVEAAEQETDYVNHVFMQQNPGFLVLYSYIKDALLSKNGFVKVYWEEREEEERETYLDQPDDAFAMIAAAEAEGTIEIVEHTARDVEGYQPDPANPDQPAPQLHDVTVVTTKKYECAKVEGVPPEEFGIARNAKCIREADYCFHEVLRSQAALISQGFDPAQVRKLPSYALSGNSEAQARDTVEESSGAKEGDEGINSAARLIKVTEHYIRMDYEQDGKPKLYRVTTGGENEVLKREGKPDIEPVDVIPFASMTPIIVTHRFFGKSVADLVMDIQRIKTALVRGLLDNTYMVSNPRTEVAESHAGPNTLDDLLVSRPNGIIRTKTPGGLLPQLVPSIAATIYPALEYYDLQKEQRTGVTRQGQGLDADALQNQSATAVNQAFTAAQARMKLIARIMAETGIRDLFSLLHQTIRKHGSKAQTVRLKNKWVQVDPRDWKSRNDMTITVGLGSGGKAEQLAETKLLMDAQEKALAVGMVSKKNLFNSAKKLIRVLGEKDVEAYFTAPNSQPEDESSAPIQPPSDPKLIELQAKNEIEKTQAQADILTQQKKTEAEIALAREKTALEMQQRREEHQWKMQEHQASLVGKIASHATKPQAAGPDGQPQQSGPDPNILASLMESLKPKPHGMRIVRDAQGRVSHTEPITG